MTDEAKRHEDFRREQMLRSGLLRMPEPPPPPTPKRVAVGPIPVQPAAEPALQPA